MQALVESGKKRGTETKDRALVYVRVSEGAILSPLLDKNPALCGCARSSPSTGPCRRRQLCPSANVASGQWIHSVLKSGC